MFIEPMVTVRVSFTTPSAPMMTFAMRKCDADAFQKLYTGNVKTPSSAMTVATSLGVLAFRLDNILSIQIHTSNYAEAFTHLSERDKD